MGIIVYELNEVPRRLFDFYALSHPESAFAYLRKNSALYETVTADVGNLSPWITWPTLHRGVSNAKHEISDLGQDLKWVNNEYPNIPIILAHHGVSVGVFGSLQSYPLPENLENFSFYVPDTFAMGSECYPKELSAFQAFNLSMVRVNGRNVTQGIAVKEALNFLAKSRKLGLTKNTYSRLANQLANEVFNKDRLVRRRTSQIEIAFDLYFDQLKNKKPDISFFFTNHVASSMHRYWPTIFPEDYEAGIFDKEWRKRWKDEIPHAIQVANYQLEKLISFCNTTQSELIVCSSMGQGAVTNVTSIEKQVLITNINRLMKYLGFHDDEWQPKQAMAPQVVITPLTKDLMERLKRISRIKINGKNILLFETSTGDIRFDIQIVNQDTLVITDGGTVIRNIEIGIENVHLQDAAGSYAYHIPEGILLHYDTNKLLTNSLNSAWTSISVLDFAPSILRKFSIQPPSYMENSNIIFN